MHSKENWMIYGKIWAFKACFSALNKKDGYRQLNVRQLGSLDHRGKCYIDRKRIQCLSNASQLSSTISEI